MNTILNLIEGLKMKIEALEKLSHQPQNYKEKCEDMERRIEKVEKFAYEPQNWIHGMSLEKRIKKLEVLAKVNMVINAEERISKLESIIVTEMINENKKPT